MTSEQSLVAEAVCGALATREFDVTRLRWDTSRASTVPHPTARRLVAALMITDLDRWARLRTAASHMSAVRVPWVVLTDAPRGPLWGAALEFGARAVVTSDLSLREIEEVLTQVIRGESPLGPDEISLLRESWRELRTQRESIEVRLESLTPRERQVLGLLHEGASVAAIATRLEVTTTTVRSQVKAILRKLGVGSQLAAVAIFDRLLIFDEAAASEL